MESETLAAQEIQQIIELVLAIPSEDRYSVVGVRGRLEDVAVLAVVTIGAYFFFKWLFSG